jgi:uncharacterized protein (DUF1330 family)
MNSNYKVALAVLVDAAIGAAAAPRLHAQAQSQPPAYFIVEIDKINDAVGLEAVVQRSRGGADVAKELGGHYIARTYKIAALDGTPPVRFIAYAFDSVEKAQAFNNTPYMKEVNAIRDKTTQARSFIVEGVPQ